MNRIIPIILAALLLSGCAAFTGIGGAIGGQVAGGIGDKIEDTGRAIDAWLVEFRRIAQAKASVLERQAIRLENEGKFREAIDIYDELLEDLKEREPTYLVQKLAARIKARRQVEENLDGPVIAAPDPKPE